MRQCLQSENKTGDLKKKAAVHNFLIQFKVESIFKSEKYFQHLQDRSSGFVIRNKNCGMSKELAALVKTLKDETHSQGEKMIQ